MNETIIGYHGTSKDNASLIIKENFRINKDEHNKLYLGAGVYFFYKIDDAVDWNIKLFEKEYSSIPKWQELIENYSVVESEIYVDNKDILDLDQKENLYKLEMLIKKFEKFNELRLYPRKMFCVKDVGIISKNIEKIDIDENLFNSIIYFY